MRDLLVAIIVFGSLPFILRRPFWGIVLLAGLGYMNPHRLCYGFMVTMPVVQIVAIVTLVGMLASKQAKRMVWSTEIWVLLIFVLWMGITTTQALYSNLAFEQLEKVVKIQILTFMTLLMLTSRERVHILVWTIAASLAFYGIKGGIFTIVNGGVYRVQGPPSTFIGGNNEMALALVMTIPLLRYLQLHEKSRFIRLGLAVTIALAGIAAVGSQSRGALVALVITGAIFWLKSRNKFVTALLIAAIVAAVLAIMPPEWYARMQSIETYEEDGSAMGRINAWWTAFNVANGRFFGGGYQMWHGWTFAMYAPNPDDVHDAHSIYFKVLGEHGWIGLGLFLLLLGLTWLKCGRIIRMAAQRPEAKWARDLAAMIQVSLVAYMSAGTFLGLSYFDYLYHLVAIVVVTHSLVAAYEPKTATSAVPVERLSLLAALRQA